MRTVRQDVLYALRQMRLSPVFTLTAMLTLALGIGATTAIFSLIHTVMLKSLPVVDPSRRAGLHDELEKVGAQAWMTGADAAVFAEAPAAVEIFEVTPGKITRRL